jgi:hypothetical protein
MARMMSYQHSRPSHPGPVWVGRFGAHLMVVMPSVNLTRAVHSAVAAWPYAAHLEPEDAAEILLRRMAYAAATRLR